MLNLRSLVLLPTSFALALAGCPSTQNTADSGPDAADRDAVTQDTVNPTDVPVAMDARDVPNPPMDVPVVMDARDVQNPPDNVVPTDNGPLPDVQPGPAYCSIGSDVPGAVVPSGFCMRQFAQVNSPRTLAVAPNGDLFVGAPSTFAPGGSNGGPGAVVVVSDDNHDNVGELHTFIDGFADVHGIALGGGNLYFTTQGTVFRTPYADGQRAASGAPEDMNLPAEYAGGGRWTHGLALSVGGNLFSSRGQYASCGGQQGGSIYQVTPGALSMVSTGFRNPMYMRCHFRDEVCMASELGEDGSQGATEKLLFVRPSTDFGYPCCFSTGRSASGTDCSMITAEDESIPLSDTPFGLDWERGVWEDAQYRDGLFVALHGSFYSSPQWQGAAVVYFQTDPATHRPTGTMQTFIGGWGSHDSAGVDPLRRPSDVAFAPDGRMFIADDIGGMIYMVAPTTLRMPGQ